MKHGMIAIAALALAACSPPQGSTTAVQDIPPQTPAGAEPAGCFAEASHDWSAVGSQYYVIEAEARGATCREATATLRITSREGATLFEKSYETQAVPLAFSPMSD